MKNSTKESIEQIFQEFEEKAKEMYPGITTTVENYNNLKDAMTNLQQYEELVKEVQIESTSNRIILNQ